MIWYDQTKVYIINLGIMWSWYYSWKCKCRFSVLFIMCYLYATTTLKQMSPVSYNRIVMSRFGHQDIVFGTACICRCAVVIWRRTKVDQAMPNICIWQNYSWELFERELTYSRQYTVKLVLPWSHTHMLRRTPNVVTFAATTMIRSNKKIQCMSP